MAKQIRKIVIALALFIGVCVIPAYGASIKTLINFGGANGANPRGALAYSSGYLYATTKTRNQLLSYSTASGQTGLIQVPSGAVSNFGSSANPGSLISANGVLYGVSYAGGDYGEGSIFSYSGGAGFRTLVNFNGSNGAAPVGALTYSNGTLFGTTSAGGTLGDGTLFSYSTGTGLQTLANFGGGIGARPQGRVAVVGNTVYGTTTTGGGSNRGTIFAYSLGTSTTRALVTFTGRTNGSYPLGGLVNLNGTLYGTTAGGGASLQGTLFSFTPNNANLVTLASFNGSNGVRPLGALAHIGNVFYGVSKYGGSANQGALFSYSASSGLQLISSFTGSNGATPSAGLTAVGTTVFGTTFFGGSSNDGTLFGYNTLGPQYSVTVGDPAVPEPPTLAIMFSGLLGIGFLLFRNHGSVGPGRHA